MAGKNGSNPSESNSDLDRLKTAALVRSAQNGDELAFGLLYDGYFGKIYAFIFYRVSHKEIAEDLTEEVFVKAWTKIRTLSADSFGGWLYSVAKNAIIDHYRGQRETVDLAEIENSIEAEGSAIDSTELQLNQKILLDLVRKLTPEQQIVVQLKFIEGLDNVEISEMISKSEGSIRVIQHRAVQRLHELMAEYLDQRSPHDGQEPEESNTIHPKNSPFNAQSTIRKTV